MEPTPPEADATEAAPQHADATWVSRAAVLAALAAAVALAGVAVVAIAVHISAQHGARSGSSLPGVSSASSPSPSPSSSPSGWTTLSLPSGFSPSGVSCPDPGDCWLLGPNQSATSVQRGGDASATTIWQYAEGEWSSASVAGPVGLNDLACPTPVDCWAVGWLVPPAGINTDGILQPVIEQSTGGPFAVVSSPAMTGLDELDGVTCVGADDCWAVGSYGSQTITQVPGSIQATETVTSHPLVEHYDGTGWTLVTVAAPAGNSGLSGVTCVSAEDCWAVGQEYAGGVLIEQYSAGAWAPVASPQISGNPDDTLSALSCATAEDCWAVGSTGMPQTATAPTQQSLALHYTGGTWTPVTTPGITSANGGGLTGIACPSADDCWAVGTAEGPAWDLTGSPPPDMAATIVEHWSGGSWQAVSGPQADDGEPGLRGITCPPTNDPCYAFGNDLFAALAAP
jgi:hypothetical protein